jgi:hypothetical protein
MLTLEGVRNTQSFEIPYGDLAIEGKIGAGKTFVVI